MGPWDRYPIPKGFIHFQYRLDIDEIERITLMVPDTLKNKSQKRPHPQVGDIVKVVRPSGGIAFGCLLKRPLVAFFAYDANELPSDLGELVKKPVAFKVWVMDRAVSSGRWAIIGSIQATAELVEH